MFRDIFAILFTLILGIIAGIASADYSIKNFSGFGKRKEGIWVSAPNASSKQSEPYEKAYDIHNAIITLGKAEGLSFWTKIDSKGEKLNPKCTYKLSGRGLPAEFFTIYAANYKLAPLTYNSDYPEVLISRTIIKDNDQSYNIYVSPHTHEQNWLAVNSADPYMLVINLYNTPLVSPSGLRTVEMPSITKISCDKN